MIGILDQKSTLKHVRIADKLQNILVESREFEVGSIFLSEKAIAKKFGVSRVTTRKALTTLVKAGYIEPRQGKGYLINALPGNGESKEQGRIGFVTWSSNMKLEGDIELKEGLWVTQEYCRVQNYSLERIPLQNFKSIDQNHFEGFIWSAPSEEIKKNNLSKPVVGCGLYKKLNFPSVKPDVFQAGLLMGEYIQEIGHRNIAVVESQFSSMFDITNLIIEGIHTYTAGKINVVDDRKFRDYPADITTGKILDQYPDTTLLIVLKQRELNGVLSTLHRRQLHIPSDISIIGFGNCIYHFSSYPRVTCVTDNPGDVFKAAARLLTNIINGKDNGISEILIRCDLEIFESAAPC
jgi:DNA-binding LacI/PurR family transcriptional regulator